MNKERHNPKKKQNNYGGDYDCVNYDTRHNGEEFCHDEGQTGWKEWVKWSQIDEKGILRCKGNRHNCLKLKQKWIASLPKKEQL